MKNRYFFEIAYNGSRYFGWQKQPNQISVQQTLNEAISTLIQETINANGCGRTDTGVHAKSYFFHFDCVQELKPSFCKKLDNFLPPDITIKKMFICNKRIHARFDAIRRSYEYIIHYGKDPFNILQVYPAWEKFDLKKMNEACTILLNYTDFECFSKTNNNHNHYLCDIDSANWIEQENYITFQITANRFLRSMIRLLVGTMLEIGREKLSIQEFETIIKIKDKSKVGKAMSPAGLYLTGVTYPENSLQEYLN